MVLDRMAKLGEVILVGAFIMAIGQIVQAQAQGAMISLTPEQWLAAAAIIMTTGINLEQLRRSRSDIRGLAKKVDRIDRIVTFLRTRRRDDRDIPGDFDLEEEIPE